MSHVNDFSPEDLNRIIEMAWEDRTSFEAIERQFGIKQADVIKIMRSELRLSSFKRWRERTKGCITKHETKQVESDLRFRCSRQKTISFNKISKAKTNF